MRDVAMQVASAVNLAIMRSSLGVVSHVQLLNPCGCFFLHSFSDSVWYLLKVNDNVADMLYELSRSG